MNIHELKAACAQHAAESKSGSAVLCIEDAGSLICKSEFLAARRRLIDSLKHSVGIFHPLYKEAMTYLVRITAEEMAMVERREFMTSAPKGMDFTLSLADGRMFVYTATEELWKQWKAARGHAAAHCDESACAPCEAHYPDITAQARVAKSDRA